MLTPAAKTYSTCYQLSITGGTGTANPATVKFPGAHKSSDPGILVNIHSALSQYVIPGPPVYPGGTVKKAGSGCGAGCASTCQVGKGEVGKALIVSSNESDAQSPAGEAGDAACAVGRYQQCGGNGWTGCTSCAVCTSLTSPLFFAFVGHVSGRAFMGKASMGAKPGLWVWWQRRQHAKRAAVVLFLGEDWAANASCPYRTACGAKQSADRTTHNASKGGTAGEERNQMFKCREESDGMLGQQSGYVRLPHHYHKRDTRVPHGVDGLFPYSHG